jgi:hypothetical protein
MFKRRGYMSEWCFDCFLKTVKIIWQINPFLQKIYLQKIQTRGP